MFDNIGTGEFIALVLAALFIIGPERLPKVISDGMGMLRKLRGMARNATGDLSRELGTTIELEDLHPKTFLRKHLLSEAEEASLRKPFQDVFKDVKGTADAIQDDLRGTADAFNMDKPATPATPSMLKKADPPAPAQAPNGRHAYDDAT